MVCDQYDGAAFAEWARERSHKLLGCMHVDSREWVVQEDILESISYTVTKQNEILLTDACEYSALASAILALCPPERVMPFSPISESRLVSDRTSLWSGPLTCEIPSFEYRKVPFQGARFQNSVVSCFIEPIIRRAEAGTKDDVISNRSVFKPLDPVSLPKFGHSK